MPMLSVGDTEALQRSGVKIPALVPGPEAHTHRVTSSHCQAGLAYFE